jgi:type I restriction enzyme S subunit
MAMNPGNFDMNLQFRFKLYSEYKKSGVEWLGEIPTHWDVVRICDHTTLINGYPFDSKFFVRGDGNPLIRIRDLFSNTTEVNYIGPIVEDAWVKAGDILIGMDGNFNVSRWKGNQALLNQRMCCIRSRQDIDTRFLAYTLPFPLNIINDLTYSTTVKHLSSLDVKKILFGRPPFKEQRAIADFLDRETGKIDALVAKKERLIELLQEKRTALITQAVTKGLDPNVPLKDSGVEWLGEIPEHWKVFLLKRISKRIQTGSTPPTSEQRYYEDGTIPWYGPASFGIDLLLQKPMKLINVDSIKDGYARLFTPGSTMIVTIGATIGRVGYIDQYASSNQQITAVTSIKSIALGKFLAYQFKRLEAFLQGIAPSTTLPIIDQGQVGCLEVVIPPFKEQELIVEFLDHETAKIDNLIAKIREGIERLKEYSSALISAAVTGKIDVREEIQ